MVVLTISIGDNAFREWCDQPEEVRIRTETKLSQCASLEQHIEKNLLERAGLCAVVRMVPEPRTR